MRATLKENALTWEEGAKMGEESQCPLCRNDWESPLGLR